METSHAYRSFLWVLWILIQTSLVEGQTEDECFIGCFRDNEGDRALPVRIIQTVLRSSDFTVEKCIDQCIALSMVYAGVQYQDECYCGDASTDYDRQGELPLDDCRVFACPGNQNQYCGGIGALLVYNITVTMSSQTTTTELSSRASDSSITRRTSNTYSTALYAGLGGGGATIAILIIGVIAIVNYKKRRVSSQTNVVPPDKPYMDLEPTTSSLAPAYASLGTGSVSKVEDGSYENQKVVKQHQIIHQVTINDEYLYEVPVL
ncbi:uncharacterized protein LOC129280265 [Lytechinus pictus]|uniref:uncharacterized protein LOC129280265 n=1 Tax=Lytechinus pictus TaxID=7653 RepID=UPI0030B9FCE5